MRVREARAMRLPRIARLVVATVLLAVAALGLSSTAVAKEIRKPLGTFGSAEQPSFTGLGSVAVDQSSGDVYVVDYGRNEVQTVTVSATAGQFRLKFKGEATADIAFNASPGTVNAALTSLPPLAPNGVLVNGSAGNYVIQFWRPPVEAKDVEELICENGSTPLSGGSGCAVETTVQGVNPLGIRRFHADGTPADFSALGTNAIDGAGAGPPPACTPPSPECDGTPQGNLGTRLRFANIAIDNSGGPTDGDIYLSALDDHLVHIFAPSGAYLGQLTEFKEGPTASGPLKPISGLTPSVAVDSNGDVYVADTQAKEIHKYHSLGNPVTNADSVANFTLSAEPVGLAAGMGPTSGYLFARLANPSGVFKLNASSGAVQYQLFEKGGIQLATPALAVDPGSGHLLALASSQTTILEYDASGPTAFPPRLTIPLSGEGHFNATLAVGPTGILYTARRGANTLDLYSPALIVPDVTTEAPTAVTGTSATLNGAIGAANGPNASCHFQYTTEAAYLTDKAISGHDGFTGAQSVPCEPAGPFGGSATNAVSAAVSGLSPETAYEFRLVGENENGESQGEATALETFGKPQAQGGSFSEVTGTAVKITGKVNPRGLATSFAVQYVSEAQFEASGYAEASTSASKGAGSGIGFVEVSLKLEGLAPATTYHFRLTAENEAGTATPGEDHAFTTFPQAGGLPEGRAYEQVSPTVKLGEVFPPSRTQGSVDGTCFGCVPGWARGRMAMQASLDGGAVAFEGFPFAPDLAPGPNEYVASRGGGGWATTPLSGPEYETEFRAGFRAFSDDLSRGVIRQIDPPLSPDAPPGGYPNLYLWQAGGAALTSLVTTEPPNREPVNSPQYPFNVTYAGANAGSGSSLAFSHILFEANDTLTPEVTGVAPEAPAVGEHEADLYEWSDGQLHLVNVLPGNNAAVPNAAFGGGYFSTVAASDFDRAISDDGSRVFWSAQPSGQVYVREGGVATVKVPDPGKFLTASADGSKVLLDDGHVFDLEDEGTEDLTGGQGSFEGLLGASEDLSRVYFVDTEALTPPSEENAIGEHAEAGKPNLYLSDDGDRTFIGILDGSQLDARNWEPSPARRQAQVSPDGRYLAFGSTGSLTGYDNLRPTGGCQGNLSAERTSPERCLEVFEYDAVKGSLACASCNPSGEETLGGSTLARIDFPGGGEYFRQPESLPAEGEGRLFFESSDALSTADKNGAIQDVYEWRPQGVAGCQLPLGCVDLISGGRGPQGPHAYNNDSFFLDATPSGKDAFFTTWDQLVPQDKDNLMDLYDARVGGGFELSAAEPCLGEACRGPASAAAELQSPGTSSFSEAVSPPRRGCRKGAVRRHGHCVHRRKHRERTAERGRGGSK
jgi:hypothetical protein